MLIGQKNLFKKLDSYTITTLPKTILFLGEEGCGKRTFAKYIANRLNLNIVEINEVVEPDVISEYQYSPVNTLYIIDLRNFLKKEGKTQNSFLKFIEEPGKNSFIIMTANSEIGILPTILNRCTKLYFEAYSIDELKSLHWLTPSSNEYMYKVCRTPGQLIATSEYDVDTACKLSNLILDNVETLTFDRLLATSFYINLKNREDQISFNLFLNTIICLAYESYLTKKRNTDYIIYKYAAQALQTSVIVGGLDEQTLIGFLTNVYDEVHN